MKGRQAARRFNCAYQWICNSIMASYPHNYGRFEDSYYYGVKGVESVEFDEFSILDEYLSEPEERLEVSLHEPDISIAQNEDDEAEKEIGVILERPNEPQIESEEYQPPMLVKPPTLPYIIVKPYKGVEVKECSQIFYTADTFVLDDHDLTDSFVLEVPNELPSLKEGVHISLPKYVDATFVVDISKGKGIT
ncbi:hypothetical protein Scep_013045 [Stephania cephalantha]|uniref:Uncharacterized protein n=1 Tax=Stephania cephalantha TaxID=152367 RepID=A0AAP0JII5_9MAGN